MFKTSIIVSIFTATVLGVLFVSQRMGKRETYTVEPRLGAGAIRRERRRDSPKQAPHIGLIDLRHEAYGREEAYGRPDRVGRAVVVPSPGDGNCLFSSIGTAVGENCDQVRRRIVGELWLRRDDYKPFFTPSTVNKMNLRDSHDLVDESYAKYVERMLKPGQWGGELELSAASAVY